MKLKHITFFTLAMLLTSTAHAGITDDILANAYSVESLVNEYMTKDKLIEQAKDAITEVQSKGLAGKQNEKDPPKDDVVTGDDSRPYTTNEDIKKTLEQEDPDLLTLQEQTQQAYLNKTETLYQENELEATSRDVAMGANAKIEIDPKQDASVAGSKEAIQANRLKT